ncbi:MAG: ABC transporter substrate-binding protein [Bacteriovorax sp.]
MRALIYVLTCFVLVGFAINPNQAWNERKDKKMIKISLNQIPSELDPTKLRMMEHFLLLQLYSQTLVRVDETGELVSYLAKRWEYNSKLKEYIFSLDSEAKFSDGSPVTAHDVVWSLSRHFWINSSSIVANYLKVAFEQKEPIPVNHIHPAFRIVDDHTLAVRLKSFYSPLLHVLSMPGFSITKYQNGNFLDIGSGPLRLASSENKNILVFSKNNFFKSPIELNQVSVVESPNLEISKKMFADGLIDLSLGLNVSELSSKSALDLGLTVTASESLATVHAYFNTKGILKNDQYRSLLSSVLSSSADEFAKNNLLIERLRSFFPIGVMPISYYNQKIQYKSSLIPKGTIKIVLNQNIFPQEFVEILRSKMKANNISAEIILCSGSDLLETLKNKRYDIIGSRYVGNFPDPDAFIDFINSESPIHAGEFDSRSLFLSLEKNRFNSDQEQRLNSYVKSFHEFEQQNYITPLFRLKIPIVHRKELSFPNTKFRYEGELWRIFWKNK